MHAQGNHASWGLSNLEIIKADHILREANSTLCSEAITILKEGGKTELVDNV